MGLVGAVRLLPKLVSVYTVFHATTLSFITLALLNTLLPIDLRYMNPVIPSWRIDETAICRDIDAGFGWDEDWFIECSRSFGMVQVGVACGGLVLMVAQWWALVAVRSWSSELQSQMVVIGDIEKAGFDIRDDDGFVVKEKH
ncbi:hypothetical protein OPT61_g8875 [Boeremia exigua]|uniref:Uncharacterized protein n=1 Tax=Boeremia exigua TaxID=749465 RepID=A0ACC2HWT0_9PLEO|nr:hypothetical protein OPT61_g8875 [Boeremia exigua]